MTGRAMTGRVMGSRLGAMLRRDLAILLLGGRRGGTMLPLLFFLAVAMLFPFAVGPDPKLLARTGGGVIWVAALLAAILPLDRLIEPDLEMGMFDQWSLRGLAEEWIVAVRVVAHWLSFGPPLMLAALPAAALLGLEARTIGLVELGLLAGTPGLAALGVTVAALTAGLRGGAALGGLLVIPLAVPLLVFGAGSLAPGGETGIALTAAASLVLLALAPFAGGAAVRSARG
jgi:heme exporter protein B